jgi:predicted ribosome quality control (RQC) complex YloA/Tae2 family protein
MIENTSVRKMFRNYYILEKVTEELQALVGCALVDCFSQEKNILIMNFADGIKDLYVQLNTDTKYATIFMKNSFSRARKNSIDLFPNYLDEVLRAVRLDKNDRLITFEFNKSALLAQLYGGAKSNMIGINSKNTIVDSFKKGKDIIGAELVRENSEPLKFFEMDGEKTLLDAISFSDYKLGKYYARELLKRLDWDPKTQIMGLSKQDIDAISSHAEVFIDHLRHKNQFLVLENDARLLVSQIELKECPTIKETFSSVSDAIFQKYRISVSEDSFLPLKKKMKKQLAGRIKKIEKNLENLYRLLDSGDRAAENRHIAELLLSNPKPKSIPGEEIILNDWDGSEVKVKLQDRLNLIDNAKKYFDKAKKIENDAENRQRLIPENEEELEKLMELQPRLEACESLKLLNKIKDEIPRLFGGGAKMEVQNDPKTLFKTFELDENYTLYVGKNAANNDRLTVKFAKPNDIWLHARGSGGSHVVLRMPAKTEKPPKNILQKAAQIAAYYSQQRNGKYVPVAYTHKKYVRKPKGAAPGSVTMAREQVIMVEPKLDI